MGVVEECKDGLITVIEGNKDGKCQRRTIKVGWKYIHSFGVPKFDEDKDETSVFYTVQKGDNLSKIGAKYGVAWKTIAALNSIKAPYIIRPGQKIRIK